MTSPAEEFQISSVALFGRGFDEYVRMFALEPPALAARRILDVAAGPASFTAEAGARGLTAVAIDPMYGLPVAALATHIEIDYARVLAEQRRKASLLRFGYFSSLEEAERSRRTAAARFLGDYEAGFVHGRYRGGALPRLPLADRSFDLVLCAHLLFTYARLFDYAWHRQACLELARVAAQEVRLHPVSGMDGKPYPELARLREDLAGAGVFSRVISVDYEFFLGTGTTLVLSRQEEHLRHLPG